VVSQLLGREQYSNASATGLATGVLHDRAPR
jgi:hypothetical protein